MPLIDTGNGLYTIKDGKMVPIEPSHMSMAVENRNLFEYDVESGALKLNRDEVPEGMLEQLSKMIEKNPKGIDVVMSFPFPLPGPNHLKGVGSVSYFTPEEAVQKVETEEISKHNYKGPAQRFKDFLLRYNPFS